MNGLGGAPVLSRNRAVPTHRSCAVVAFFLLQLARQWPFAVAATATTLQSGLPQVVRQNVASGNPPTGTLVLVDDGLGLLSRVGVHRRDLCPAAEDGFAYYLDAKKAAAAVVAKWGDRFDQVIFFLDVPSLFCQQGYRGTYTPLQHLADGLCLPDLPPAPGALAGIIELGDGAPLLDKWPQDGAALRADPAAKAKLDLLAQETGHAFGATVHFAETLPPTGMNESDRLLGRQSTHWSFFFGTQGSALEGNAWVDIGEGRFRAERPQGGFSLLDLYLWGLARSDEVGGLTLLTGVTLVDPVDEQSLRQKCGCADRSIFYGISWCPPCEGVTVTATARTISVEQITAACGNRTPHPATRSPFELRQAFVLVTPSGQAPKNLAKVEAYRKAWQRYFYEETRFRGRAVTGPDGYDDLALWQFGSSLEGWQPSSEITDVEHTRSVAEAKVDNPPPAQPQDQGTVTATIAMPGGHLTRQGTLFTTDVGGVEITLKREPAANAVPELPTIGWTVAGATAADSRTYLRTLSEWPGGSNGFQRFAIELTTDSDWKEGRIDSLSVWPLGPNQTGRFTLAEVRLVPRAELAKMQPPSSDGCTAAWHHLPISSRPTHHAFALFCTVMFLVGRVGQRTFKQRTRRRL